MPKAAREHLSFASNTKFTNWNGICTPLIPQERGLAWGGNMISEHGHTRAHCELTNGLWVVHRSNA